MGPALWRPIVGRTRIRATLRSLDSSFAVLKPAKRTLKRSNANKGRRVVRPAACGRQRRPLRRSVAGGSRDRALVLFVLFVCAIEFDADEVMYS